MSHRNVRILSLALVLSCACACGGGSSSEAHPTRLRVGGVTAADGIFDPAPRHDGSGSLWMSYSAVNPSVNDPGLSEVRTRIARSADGGATWTDLRVDPNNNPDPDIQVPAPTGGLMWAAWHYEVSALLYDPYDPDAMRRWKLLWHRMLYAGWEGTSVPSIENGWIGLSTAAAPDGPWSAERKLFAGTAYAGASADAFIGVPEFQLNSLNPALAGCAVFTEPGMLAKADGIYVALQCAGTKEKIVGLRCDRAFSSCTYLGDFLVASEAAPFSLAGQNLNGFAATEMVAIGGNDYLLVTPYEQVPSTDTYRGCLAFQIADLTTATLARTGGLPTLIERLSGDPASFNGACGYDSAATAAGIIYSEYANDAPHYRIYASRVALP